MNGARVTKNGSSRRQAPRAGDVFAIPLRARGYGFGRLLYLDGRWRLAEFFACFRKTPEFSNDILEAHRAMPVHNIVTLPIESGDWPVVARNTDVSSIDLESLKFYRGLKGARSSVELNGTSEAITEQAAASMASSMPQFPEYISDVLFEKLDELSITNAN